METRNRFGESSVLRELFEEDSSDFLLTVFDHLDVRHIVFVCSPARYEIGLIVILALPEYSWAHVMFHHAAAAASERLCVSGIPGVLQHSIGAGLRLISWRSNMFGQLICILLKNKTWTAK
jgi:hypothetical protein